MKKKNSVKITVVLTIIVLAVAALVICQPYLNLTPYTSDADIAEFLGDAFGKYPRFVNEEDIAKVEAIVIDGDEKTQYVQLVLDGYTEKYEAYVEEYNAAVTANLAVPKQPDFSNLLPYFETSGGLDNFIDISEFKNLTQANIYTGIYPISEDLSEFKDTTALQSLNIIADESGNSAKITDISVLSDKSELTTLSLPGNEISDISALSNLTKLEYIDLSSNLITDISALSAATALQRVVLDENGISDISALSGKEELMLLSLSDNKVSDITPITTMTAAQIISLNNNEVADVSPLAAFADSTQTISIMLTGNSGVTDWSILDTLPDTVNVLNDENYGTGATTSEEEVAADEATENTGATKKTENVTEE